MHGLHGRREGMDPEGRLIAEGGEADPRGHEEHAGGAGAVKAVFLTESLGSGGAERQLCLLAAELKRRGHEVEVATYFPGDFYAPLLDSAGVKRIFLGGSGTVQWVPRIRRFLRGNGQDVVLAFLGSCASYAELAALPFRRWGLVVSERGAKPRLSRGTKRLRKAFHLLADSVTTNSHTNRLMLETEVPALRSRVITIYNAVDLERFRPGGPVSVDGEIRLVTAAKFDQNKNVLRSIEAIDLVRKKNSRLRVTIDWFGSTADDGILRRRCMEQITRRGLEDYFRLHEATPDIVSRYRQADAVFLPSLHEGLPNSICEGMACGKPILMSSVCDAGNLVDGNGLLFSPDEPDSIAEAIYDFSSLTGQERAAMGEKSRELAERCFDMRKIADLYETVLLSACRRERPECDHWLPEIPRTAMDFLERVKQG